MKLWALCLGAFLILNGLAIAIDLSFKYDDLVIGGLSVFAGVLVILQK